MSTLIERRRQQFFRAKAEAAMKTYQEMLDEIQGFQPERIGMWVHAPVINTHVEGNCNGLYRITAVDCLCGAKLDYDDFTAPSHQHSPVLWEGLQAFYKHLGEKQQEAAFERMELDFHDRRANA